MYMHAPPTRRLLASRERSSAGALLSQYPDLGILMCSYESRPARLASSSSSHSHSAMQRSAWLSEVDARVHDAPVFGGKRTTRRMIHDPCFVNNE